MYNGMIEMTGKEPSMIKRNLTLALILLMLLGWAAAPRNQQLLQTKLSMAVLI